MGSVRARRPTKRRRVAPQEPREWWDTVANPLLAQRSGERCEHCGRTPAPGDRWERHHRIRRRDGGDRLSNILLLLARCHSYITEHPEEAVANGWSIRALDGLDPESVPVRYQGGLLYTLDDYGGRRLVP